MRDEDGIDVNMADYPLNFFGIFPPKTTQNW